MKKYALPYFLWLLIFVVFPMILIIVLAFTKGDMLDFSTFEFSLENFSRFFDATYMRILLNSILIALVTTLLCFLIGYPVAFIISRTTEKIQNILILIFIVPMWMNFLLRTYSWLNLLGKNGLINNFFGLIGLGPFDLGYNNKAVTLGMIYNFLPFMVLPIYTALSKMDKSLIEAAGDLGANNKQVFFKVIFPLSMPGIYAGVVMVFIPSLGTFVISNLLGGNKSMLIGNVIEQQFRFTGNWHFGAGISFMLLVIMLLMVIFSAKLGLVKDKDTGLW